MLIGGYGKGGMTRAKLIKTMSWRVKMGLKE